MLAAFFGALLGAFAVVALLFGFGELGDTTTTEAVLPTVTIVERVTTEIITEPGPGLASAEAVGQKVIPSIVTVEVGERTEDGGISVFASGSGVVISPDGHIVTNNHVVEDATAWRAIFQNGAIYTAELLGTDHVTDLAVLQISADDLVPIEFGST